MPVGSKFDDFLKEEGIFEITTAVAIKKVLAFQIEEEMQVQRPTKTARFNWGLTPMLFT